MDWRETITRRWQYKVAALFLALLLWVTVTADEQQEQAVPTRVDWQVADSSRVLVEAPGRVQTVFQAQTGQLLSFVGNDPVIRYRVDSVTGPRMRVSLTTDMVEFGRVGNARPVTVRPSEVVLRFEPRAERRVPVTPSVEVAAADGYAVVDSPSVQPDSVTVIGAESEVAAIEGLSTEQVRFGDLRGRLSRDVPVALPDDAPHVRSDPAIVLVTAEVDSVVVRELRRPVGVRGGSASAFRLDPDSVTVELRGPSSVMADLAADSVRPRVDLAEGAPGEGEVRSYPVSVELSGYPAVTAEPSPAEVDVRRGGGP